MKLKIKREVLLEHLNYVSPAISSKTLIPILTGIKFDFKEEGLYLTSSDSDISIKTFIKNDNENIIDAENTGSIVLYGRFILDIIRKLEEDFINIEVVDGLKTIIWTKNSEFNINGIDPNEYPNIEFEENKKPILMDKLVFKNIVSQTAFATASQESRSYLTGINFKLEKDTLECTATDSYRLAKKTVKLPNEVKEEVNIIIPTKNLLELSKILKEEDGLEIHIFNNKVLFKFDDILFECRILAGTYPDTSALIPKDFEIIIKAKKQEFNHVLDRASILVNDKDKNIVNLKIRKNDIKLLSNSPEIGKVEEIMEVEKEKGDKLDISFSSKYMMDALRVINTDDVELLFNGNESAIIIKGVSDDTLVQLILPIKVY